MGLAQLGPSQQLRSCCQSIRPQHCPAVPLPQPHSYYAAHQPPSRHRSAAAAAAVVGRRSTVVGMMTPAASGTPGTAAAPVLAAEAVVQKQLEAYNARDLEAFMALMSEDVVATDAVTGAVLLQGTDQCRQRYQSRFQTAVHSELLGRLCLGDVVVDREIITGLPDGAAADCLATYHCKGGKIVKMSFVWQPRP